MMEQIAAAAIRVGQEVYTGPTHFKATIKIIQMPGLDPGMIAGMLLDGVDGFVTDEGRFVTRAEGFRVATAAHQVLDNELADPERNMQFYETAEPSLDSGMIARYAPLSVSRAHIY